jgi:hypothetical protein
MTGAISEETEQALDKSHQSVSARYTELRQWGFITYLTDSRGNPITRKTKSRRNAYVHVATALGRQAVKLGFAPGDRDDPTRGFHRGNPMSEAAFNSTDLRSLRMNVLKHINSRTPQQLDLF